MSDDEFLSFVETVYRKEFRNFGFIPKTRFREYLNKGQFFRNDDGFILTGSLRSEVTPIYAVYVHPEKRSGTLGQVDGLLELLPKKSYRVRCHFGKAFWQRRGFVLTGTSSNNWRRREIYTLVLPTEGKK